MQMVSDTLHNYLINIKLFLCFLNRDFAELFEVLHKVESSLTGTCTGGLVSLNNLSLCICLEVGDFSSDFFNELFHFFVFLRFIK